MWIILILIGILFVDYAAVRVSHLKNDAFADDRQQMYALQRSRIQEEGRTEK